MLTFVLSGGGNRGALQAGALEVLLERGIHPQMVIGTSAGALNAAFLALDPTLEGTRRLREIWCRVRGEHLFPGNWFTMLWRALNGEDSLFPNTNLHRFIESNLQGVRRFGEITGVRLYIVATQLDNGALHLFGEDPEDSIVDALMSSTALPPWFPPWQSQGRQYIDGGAVADLPLGVALEKGAENIYALHAVQPKTGRDLIRGLFNIADYALGALVQHQVQDEIRQASGRRGTTLHYVPIVAQEDLPLWDFSHTEDFVALGRQTMEAYLAEVAPPRPKGVRTMVWGAIRKTQDWVEAVKGRRKP